MRANNSLFTALFCGFTVLTVAISSEPIEQPQQLRTLSPNERTQLLVEREKVWRAYFTNDRKHLEAVLPPETIAINAYSGWHLDAGK
ncbi:hypothetical protein HUU05_05175 [candidate division KSB1 bacterium]|nr:hypothetical protein [candidate division KSB1 bacterium]